MLVALVWACAGPERRVEEPPASPAADGGGVDGTTGASARGHGGPAAPSAPLPEPASASPEPPGAEPPPTAPSPPSAAEEGLLPSEIEAVLAPARQRFRECYEARLVFAPRLAGRVTLDVVVGPEGRVTEATVQESTLRDAEVEACLVRVARGLAFPRPGGGGEVVVRAPLAFGSGG